MFLANKFDKRLLFGSDYPDFNLKEYIICFNKLIKKSKISKSKIHNLKNSNLDKILND